MRHIYTKENVKETDCLMFKIKGFNPPENIIFYGRSRFHGYHILNTNVCFWNNSLYYTVGDTVYHDLEGSECIGRAIAISTLGIEKFMPGLELLRQEGLI